MTYLEFIPCYDGGHVVGSLHGVNGDMVVTVQIRTAMKMKSF